MRVALLVLVFGVVYFCVNRKKRKKKNASPVCSNDPSTISIEHPILKFLAKLDKDPSEESVLRYLYEHKSLTVAA